MLFILLTILCSVSAYSPATVYPRSYLRGLRNQKLIHEGATFIRNNVLAGARQGSLKYTLGPMPGCEAFKTLDLPDKETCEGIVKGIETIVVAEFPDIDITYDPAMKTYTLKWD